VRTLLIDDTREISATVVCRNYFDAIKALTHMDKFDLLYLDHDLASYDPATNREYTGYDVVLFLEANPQFLPKDVQIVSSNPVGRQKMGAVLSHIYGRQIR